VTLHPILWAYYIGVLCNWLLTRGYFGQKLAEELDNRGSHIAGFYIIKIHRWFSWFTTLLLLVIYAVIIYKVAMGMTFRNAVDNLFGNPEQ